MAPSPDSRPLFGTDGIRATFGDPPLTPRCLEALGRAIAQCLKPRRLLIGRDPRRSGPEMVNSLTKGLASCGVALAYADIVPTPAISFLTRAHGFDLGIMVTASHNPPQDNGIKIFTEDGEKLAAADQAQIETTYASVYAEFEADRAAPTSEFAPISSTAYRDHLVALGGGPQGLKGLCVVIDCANGAMATLAPETLALLGVDVHAVSTDLGGEHINENCGALFPQRLAELVTHHKAHCGLSFDGDGDRCIVVSEDGRIHDGDALLFGLARALHKHGRLGGESIVATIDSNLALTHRLADLGIDVMRTDVGDRFVSERLRTTGGALGGERSGHIILPHHVGPTGCGLGATIVLMALSHEDQVSCSQFFAGWAPYPQSRASIRVQDKPNLATLDTAAAAIQRVAEALGQDGRSLVRYSGTEPILRIMVEHPVAAIAADALQQLETELRRALDSASALARGPASGTGTP